MFSNTDGYAGLAILCVALDSRVRMWLVPGAGVTTQNISVPVESQSSETFELDLADDFCRILDDPGHQYALAGVEDLVRPQSKKGQAEFDAFARLAAALPLDFQPAAVEGSHHDCTVAGAKWQLKLAALNAKTDRYVASVQKQVGRCGAKRKHAQYASEDFDYLCVQMPAASQSAYVFPVSVLMERGKVGRGGCCTGTLHFYPHRRAHPKTDWVEAYRIDLTSPRRALRDYRRVVAS